jgi:hypothetical protein
VRIVTTLSQNRHGFAIVQDCIWAKFMGKQKQSLTARQSGFPDSRRKFALQMLFASETPFLMASTSFWDWLPN